MGSKKEARVGPYLMGGDAPLSIFCGPCVIESEGFAIEAAHELREIFSSFPLQWIFKASYDKANRSSLHSFRGPGLEKGLFILQRIQKELGVPVLTDVHTPDEAKIAGEVCDVIQIPAFLCRQTDLLAAAAQTKAAVNVKKGQFLAPWDMGNVIEKLSSFGKKDIIVTDRGTCFGYNNLVSDMRAIPIMQGFGVPVCFDATHSVQLPGGLSSSSGGQREYVAMLSRCAVAAGVEALFIEAHPHPKKALSDAASMIGFQELPHLLSQVEKIFSALKGFSHHEATPHL